MRLIIMILFCAGLLLLLEKPLKKHSTVFYIAAVLMAAAGYLVQTRLQPGIVRTILADYLTSGTLPAALFVLVMYAAVLPRKSRLFRCAMSCRGELAILASLLGLTHMVYYGHAMGQKTARAGIMASGMELVTAGVILLLVLLLVPLTVTSFKRIRRKMNGKRWKKLQRWSYLFYGLLYLHAAMAIYPRAVAGNPRYLADFCCYTAVFGIYAVLRVEKLLEKKKKQAYCAAVWSLLVVLLMLGSFSLSYGTAKHVTVEEQTEVRSEMKTEEKEVSSESDDKTEPASEYADGTWEGEGLGLNGPVRAALTVEDGRITEIKILERTDDDPYFTDARVELVPKILEQQSADVDTVSGATFSSEGILEAVEEALKHAVEAK